MAGRGKKLGGVGLVLRGGVRFRRGSMAQTLGHDDNGAAVIGFADVKFVHERTHEENTAARTFQKVFVGEGIGNVLNAEALALIADVDNKLFGSEFKGEIDFLVALLLASVVVGIDDAFADGHTDLETVVIIEARGAGNARTHFFRKTYAIKQRLECDVNALSAHSRMTVGRRAQGECMGNTAFTGKSMREMGGGQG